MRDRMRSSLPPPRGSALLITVMLLMVLGVAGVAVLSLTSRDRRNASAQARYQALVECGSAAQAVIWAQLARHGTRYIGSKLPVGVLTMPDGTQLAAPIHYDRATSDSFADVSYTVVSGGGGAALADVDCSNRLCGQTGGGGPVVIMARCTDPRSRQYEVELSFAFAL